MALAARVSFAGDLSGWAPDGSFYVERGEDGGGFPWAALCLTEPGTPSRTWPKEVARPEAGERDEGKEPSRCSTLCDGPEGARCFTALEKKLARWGIEPPVRGRVGPNGETVALRSRKRSGSDETRYTHAAVITRGELQWVVPLGESGDDLVIDGVSWRPPLVAVHLGWLPEDPDRDDSQDLGGGYIRNLLGIGRLAGPGRPVGNGDRETAAQENRRGMAAYRVQAYAIARESFRAAQATDPSWVQARYNLAALASRTGDLAAARAGLTWLAHRNDGEARVKLLKSRGDGDFDLAAGDPETRQLLGLAPLDGLDAAARLTERAGAWTLELACAHSQLTLVFGPGGKLTVDYVDRCDARGAVKKKLVGTFTADAVEVPAFRRWPGPSKLGFVACPTGSCLALTAGATELGPFHRGRASR